VLSTPRPPFADVLWASLLALRELGGSGANQEIARKALEVGNFTDDQRAVLHRGVGPETEIGYRVAWARTYLKGVGALVNSQRGVWSLTEYGWTMTRSDVEDVQAEYQRRRAAGLGADSESQVDTAGMIVDEDEDWRSALLGRLLELSPTGFERLTKRLLREAGFASVEVTRSSGDGGIDGTGFYSPATPSLISFPVVFQCKRYQGSVGPSVVRDLRGAMSGRGERGILVTTGSFTRDARAEASRDGVPVIELVDGERLCDLMKELGLGVAVETVERVSVEPDFFAEMETAT
jgi:restriction system protein